MTTRQLPISKPSAPRTGALAIADSQTLIRPAITFHILLLLAFFLFDSGGMVCIIVYAILLVVFAVAAYFQLKALGNKVAALWAVLALLPIVGLAILLHINAVATQRLRAAGLKVRLLGVPKPDRNTLRTALARESGR